MQKNRRMPKNGSGMDGFVHRSRANAPRKVFFESLETPSAPRRRKTMDGFVPRNPAVNRPVTFEKESPEELVDENTLTIDPSEMTDSLPSARRPARGEEKQPHFWQIFKKRRLKRGKPAASLRKKIVKRIILIIVITGVVLAGFLGWKFLRATSKVFNGNILGFFDSTKLKGEETGRVNILLAGTSEDDIDHGGADLTDSIMIASLDTKNNTGFTVSIPRDLWVDYGARCTAGYEGKINATYQCGNATNFKEDGYPEGGMGLLQKVVSTNLGLPIHYYGKLNYTAFKDAVDAVGGIKIDIKSSDPRGIYDPNIQPKDGGPVRLKNGPQELDGKLALALARSRNVAGGYGMSRGDFDRTSYQQAMLVALKDKALSAGVISNPAKLSSLLDAAGDNVETNFKSNEVRRLYDLSKLISNDKIQSIDLVDSENMLVTTGNYNGQSIVRPTAGVADFSEIKSFFKKLASNDPVTREGASVVVLNASGVTGLAQKRADELTVKGIGVDRISNAAKQENTVIIDRSNGAMNGTKSVLEKHFKVTPITDSTSYPEASAYEADFIIFIGVKSAISGSHN